MFFKMLHILYIEIDHHIDFILIYFKKRRKKVCGEVGGNFWFVTKTTVCSVEAKLSFRSNYVQLEENWSPCTTVTAC